MWLVAVHSPLPACSDPQPSLPFLLAADVTPLVSAAAQAAVGSVCWWCGYGGSLRQLVAANADYVVDGMCAQLRQVGQSMRVHACRAAVAAGLSGAAGLCCSICSTFVPVMR